MYKLVLIGDPGAGKSSIVTRLCFDFFDGFNPTEPSISAISYADIVIDGEACVLQLLDTGHPEEGTVAELAADEKKKWVQESDGVVIVYDVCKRPWRETPMQRVWFHWEYVQELTKSKDGGDRRQNTFPIMVLGAQNDRVEDRVVQVEEGDMISEGLGCLFGEVSAKNGEVERQILRLVRMIREKKRNIVVEVLEKEKEKEKAEEEKGFWKTVSNQLGEVSPKSWRIK